MNLVYTHDIFSGQEYGGISRYFFELINRIPPDKANIRVFAGLYINEHIKGLSGLTGIRVPSLKHTGTIRLEISALLQRLMLSTWKDTEIVHQTYYSRFAPPKKAKYVITIYDMINERFPEYFFDQNKESELKKKCCEQADKIIAISNSTRKDLIDFFGIDPQKIVVIHLGSSLKDTNQSKIKVGLPEPYLLYVGKRDEYKNFGNLIQAFANSRRIKNRFHILCFGGGAFDDNEIQKFNDLGIADRIHQISGDDAYLTAAYQQAVAFICPSLYEGFGIPLLEAMSLSCPVICSDTSSIPEVVGNAGVYFSPTSISSIQNALENTLFQERMLADLRDRGIQRESKFSWDACARETMALYRSLMS